MPAPDDRDLFAADAADRRAALQNATDLMASLFEGQAPRHPAAVEGMTDPWLYLATSAYRWLRCRETLRVARIELTPGTPRKEGTPDMATTFNLQDDNEVTFTLTGFDDKGASVAAPADTWSWSLADPDSSGAVLTVSDDTLSATVAGGTPDTNLMLSVAGATTGLTGAEAIIVLAGPATTIGLVAGDPSAEPAPEPSA